MKAIPRYLYRGTTTLHYGGSMLWMHADPERFGDDRIYFTNSPSKALEYSDAGYGGNAFGHPLVVRIDTRYEPEVRRMLRKGISEPNEYYVPVGILRLRNEPLVVRVGRTGQREVLTAPTWNY